jgi:hypothetical protein
MKHVRVSGVACLLAMMVTQVARAQQSDGPTDPKAQKTYATGNGVASA